MNKKRQKQIEEIATTTLQKCGCYPMDASELDKNSGIDIKKVISTLGIELMVYDFGENVSGVLIRDGEGAKIGYASHNGPRRQRFTIAHELGHYILGHQRQGIFVDTPEKYFTLFRDHVSSTGEDSQEREANAFAASILMPRNLLIEAATKIYQSGITRNEEFDIVEELAEKFQVSKLAMSIRFTNLDLIW
ncbi:ImmA/IrrE family metallo-endopeptidase [Cytophagaceae bacterium YF14B1]|uniref:ImmA/IrrE family metallo-endopeptidase n=1 Tax=Xanthocytophaga flava TaxID=3048013 RepID=A0AAE3UD77_9BACT|nr:ImmA/IrrE family metallo-endopeptidase [Xanthocytophaga flavus]MDJ1486288.1 ImmA/IrrE family metallo-endopeptidase [Xanthocytophaga flavus]